MLVINGPGDATRIANSEVRRLVEQRYAEVCAGEPYDYDSHGSMIVVEPGDTVAALEREGSCRILRNLFDGTRFPHPEFSPSFEALDEHAGCYELLFILNDEGFGITYFIPKAAGVNAENAVERSELLAMCAEFATPAINTP